jgi:plastocyanin
MRLVSSLARMTVLSRRAGRGGTTVLGVALGCVLATASPAAAALWTATTNLSEAGHSASAPEVAVDGAGDALVVWTRSNGANDIVQAAVKPAGEAPSMPVNLSAPGEEASEPQIAVDPAGEAVAVWVRSNGSNEVVQAAVKPPGKGWGKPVSLSGANEEASQPQVSLDEAGDATVVWLDFDGSNHIVQAATMPAGDGWGKPVNLSPAGQEAARPDIAVDGKGGAVAVWAGHAASGDLVQAAVKAAHGRWGEPATLSAAGQDPGQEPLTPRAAIDAAGSATAVWVDYVEDGNAVVQTASKAAGKPWSTTTTISETGQEAFGPRIAVNAAGEETTAWNSFRYGCCYLADAAIKPAGEAWGKPVSLADGSDPQVAVNAAGDASTVWDSHYGPGDTVQAAIAPAGEPWESPTTLSEVGEDAMSPELATNAAGETTATWTRYTGGGYGEYIVQIAQHSNAPFTIETLQKLSTESVYTSSELTAEVGETVDYEVVVTNTHGLTLTFGPLKDAWCEGIDPAGATELEAGRQETFTCTHKLAGLVDYGNEASIEGGEGIGTKTSNRVSVEGREAAPTFEHLAIEAVTRSSATFTAVLNPNGLPSQLDFFVSHNGSSSYEYDQLAAASNEDETVEVHVGGMSPGCSYRVEADAFNNDGSTMREYIGEVHTNGQQHGQCEMPVEQTSPAFYGHTASDVNSHEGLLEAIINPDGKWSKYEFVLFYKACQGSGCPEEYESHTVVAKGVIPAGYRQVTVTAQPQVKPGCEYSFGVSASNSLGNNALEAWWEGPHFTTYAEGLTEAHSCTP